MDFSSLLTKITYHKYCYEEDSFMEDLVIYWEKKNKLFNLDIFLLIFASWQILSIKTCQ